MSHILIIIYRNSAKLRRDNKTQSQRRVWRNFWSLFYNKDVVVKSDLKIEELIKAGNFFVRWGCKGLSLVLLRGPRHAEIFWSGILHFFQSPSGDWRPSRDLSSIEIWEDNRGYFFAFFQFFTDAKKTRREKTFKQPWRYQQNIFCFCGTGRCPAIWPWASDLVKFDMVTEKTEGTFISIESFLKTQID